MQRKGDSAMKIRLKPQLRPFFGKLTTIGFVLVLLALLVVSLPIWLFVARIVLVFALGLILGFTFLGGIFAFAVTAIAAWVAWFCYSLIRDVWAEFSLHRTARKASAGP